MKYNADWRALLFLSLATAAVFVQWQLPETNWLLWAGAMFIRVTVTTIAHNHNHVGMWKNRMMNRLTDYWLTLFYGFPAFAWIPTHNLNHHKLTNKEGDYTTTWGIFEANNLFTLLTYPATSAWRQQKPTSDYLKKLWEQDQAKFWYCMSQYALWIGAMGTALYLDWYKGLMYFVIPGFFALYMVLIFNYVQHIHCDELSELDHSRNFLSPIMNFWLLNNGFHTVHHEKMGMHWSLLKEEHYKNYHDKINPALNERGFFSYMIRQYLLSPIVSKWSTRNFRLERMQKTAAA